MHTTPRSPLSPDDAFVLQVSTLARKAARRLLVLHNRADADDIAQDVTLECLAAIQSGRMATIQTDIAALVWTMVLRRTLNVARAADRRDARAVACVRDEDEVHTWMSPEAAVEYAELEAFVAQTVAALPPMSRRVFQMVRDDNMSYANVARSLGITRHTVNEHLTTAQRRLRAALVDAGLIPSRMSRTCRTDVKAESSEVAPQPPDPTAPRQDSAA